MKARHKDQEECRSKKLLTCEDGLVEILEKSAMRPIDRGLSTGCLKHLGIAIVV
jgi:hypothetical protein